MNIDHGTWVAVCDGGKFLLLQNRGDAEALDLRVVAHEELDTGTRPGRADRGPSPDGTQALVGRSQTRSVEELSEHRFVHSVAAELDERVRIGSINKMVLVADPKTLGLMRARFQDLTRDAISEEIGGDFAHNTVAEVEALLTRYKAS